MYGVTTAHIPRLSQHSRGNFTQLRHPELMELKDSLKEGVAALYKSS